MHCALQLSKLKSFMLASGALVSAVLKKEYGTLNADRRTHLWLHFKYWNVGIVLTYISIVPTLTSFFAHL